MQNNDLGFQQKPKKQFGIITLVSLALIIGSIGFVLGTRAQEVMLIWRDSPNKNVESTLDFNSLNEIYDKLRADYDGKLDTEKLLTGAKKGMVEATGDPYTTYFTNDEAKEFFGDLEGKFSGIGAELAKRNDRLVVVATLDDTPARKSGLLPDDAIVKVNDQETIGWTVEKAVSNIRGDAGTTVKLTVLRGDQELKEFSIVRAQIVSPSVTHQITADNVGYLRISRFAEGDTIKLATKAAEEFKAKNVKGVVLDMRGNGGGYLESAQQIVGLWLNGKVVVEERQGDKVVETLRGLNDPILAGVKTVVLVDGGSASASEIVAGALQDHKAATLVGQKTFGKGSVQQIKPLSTGGQLKVTVAKWFTPNGKNITKEGIKPDIEVKSETADLQAGRDVQKERALQEVK